MSPSLPHTCYLVCATPRSGSSLLCETLERTGLAGRPQEYFWHGFEPEWSRRWGVTGYPAYLQAAFAHGTGPNGVFGAKIMWAHLEYLADQIRGLSEMHGQSVPELLDAAFPNLHYIWIVRRDTVRQAVSLWKAAQTMVWNDTGGELDAPSRPPVYHFRKIDQLVQNLEQRNASWEQFFRHAGIEPFRVTYEDLERDTEGYARRILSWIGVEPPNVLTGEGRLRKQADRQSESWVERYLAARQRLEQGAAP